MLEVGNLANATEDRSHFGAWAIVSSPLILSFNLSDQARMQRAWSIISNRAVLEVNQRWVGSPGRRVALASDRSWQAWAKPMGPSSYAVFLLNAGASTVNISLPLKNISAAFTLTSTACARYLYVRQRAPMVLPHVRATLAAHDSAMYCIWPRDSENGCDCDHECP